MKELNLEEFAKELSEEGYTDQEIQEFFEDISNMSEEEFIALTEGVNDSQLSRKIYMSPDIDNSIQQPKRKNIPLKMKTVSGPYRGSDDQWDSTVKGLKEGTETRLASVKEAMEMVLEEVNEITSDILTSAVTDSAATLQDVFEKALKERISCLVDQRKEELAQEMFTPVEEDFLVKEDFKTLKQAVKNSKFSEVNKEFKHKNKASNDYTKGAGYAAGAALLPYVPLSAGANEYVVAAAAGIPAAGAAYHLGKGAYHSAAARISRLKAISHEYKKLKDKERQ